MRLWIKGVLVSALFLFLAAASVHAEDIYKWTDTKGVQKFSNKPPPEGTDYEIIKGVSPNQAQDVSPDQAQDKGYRESYERMMEGVERQNRQSDAESRQKALERAQEEQHKAETERVTRIQAERRRLQQQIDEINQRGLGPYYTEGMRRAQIKEIQEKIDALEAQGSE
ncbi:MAG: hypothetical protein VR64_05015 [Desulfatitalea sp. BRH_c12]|nr:MAG: hypothetical protein VR64_05015 [Desulfatitalea sp. BRH_c12]